MGFRVTVLYMPFSPTFLVEIDKELASLRGVRDKLDERIRALEAIKQPLDILQVGLPFPSNMSESGNPVNGQEPFRFGETFRDTVREAMKRIGPARAPAVARWLEARGFVNESSTRLATRVYNDMWRMAQTGMATAEDGVFRLVEKDDQ
jgi:hypothetical protein